MPGHFQGFTNWKLLQNKMLPYVMACPKIYYKLCITNEMLGYDMSKDLLKSKK